MMKKEVIQIVALVKPPDMPIHSNFLVKAHLDPLTH